MNRYSVEVNGIVQGVGFRPFTFRTAKAFNLCGFVQNTSEGVLIEIQGERNNCNTFVSTLKNNPPPLAYIEDIKITKRPLKNESDFVILASSKGTRNTLISPDIGICDDCAADIKDKANRRYKYAFTNCTNCGPRFTIVYDIPYDRKNTTMKEFKLCDKCSREFEDPKDRRFHAQPNACPKCGPQLIFYYKGKILHQDPYELFKQFIAQGKIVATKGIGGYHLACDAKNEQAVARLRNKKSRYNKPLAVMMNSLNVVKKYCLISSEEQKLLTSPVKPILLLKKKKNCPISESTTMMNKRLGVMLPYTPLHCILMEDQEALVMTSCNSSGLPMIYKDDDIMQSQISDAVLTHNRRICRRIDDSVCIVVKGKVHLIRRARGYVPEPLKIEGNNYNILAMGAQQKNTFCLLKKENAFISGHMGDLDELETEKYYKNEIETFTRIFDAKPEAVACDLHPDYVSTRLADLNYKGIPILKIQHHHAHFASVLAEHGIADDDVLGLIFDGTGYGEDGCIWGGEALIGSIKKSVRIGHLLNFPLLGGEAAVKEPWRTALALADISIGREYASSLFPEYSKNSKTLFQALDSNINSPLTSSMGRLFDGVAALIDLRRTASYDGQPAIELQQIIDENSNGSYHFDVTNKDNMFIFDWRQVIREIVSDLKSNVPPGAISLKFHNAIVDLTANIAVLIREKNKTKVVALSGGVFQNDYLLEKCSKVLENNGFTVYSNEKVPANDGGISFGQSAAAAYRMR
jgi:hydrogenase maturation protein HypF